MELLKTQNSKNNMLRVKVYWDSYYQEYIVRQYKATTDTPMFECDYVEVGKYHCDDKDDAFGTARYFIKNSIR